MTKIEFILLADDSTASDMFSLICQRARAACHRGGLYIHGKNEQECKALDEHLWTSNKGKFIPHTLVEANLAGEECTGVHTAEVVVSCDHEPDGSHLTLLNTSGTVPWFFSRFENLIELVRSDERERKMGRERYLYYKTRGYPLSHRQL